MVSTEKNDLKNELTSKKDVLKLKVKNIEKEENKMREEANVLQKEVLSKIGK